MPPSDVLVDKHDAVVVIRFNRPASANSVHGTLFRDLIAAVEDADRDPAAGAIVTVGEGKSYCVGADRDVMLRATAEGPVDLAATGVGPLAGDTGIGERSETQRRADDMGIGRWVLRFLDVGLPTVAAINGGVAGGGLGLALLHDVRIASRSAKLATNFVALGVSPELGISWTLPRIVGWSKAFQLLTRRTVIDADEALELGLVESVVEPREVLEAAISRGNELAALPQASMRMAKRLLRQSGESSMQTQLEREWTNQVRLFGDPQTGERVRDVLGGTR
jgi:2-(1,2-epoxy-1,2-dihydrophenyl)acetyl-CoA isomerase